MDGDGEKRVCVEGLSKIDWLSILPESLLCKVLLNLPTKDVVKTSVLSKRWRNLWRYVPGLDLDECNFPDHKTFISFVDTFLGFNSESYLECFKLKYHGYGDEDETEIGLVKRWINTVTDRKIQHLAVLDDSAESWDIQMPPNLYTCESLVCLKLSGVTLASPKFVSLPSLKFMDLTIVHFANNLDLEALISHCPVLESLFIERSFYDDIEVLRVCSKSLLSFTHVSDGYEGLVEDLVVAINAPRLQYLRLDDCRIRIFTLNNVIYHYSRCEELPLCRNLSFLRVRFTNSGWEMLPIFLERCPNLKSLVVASTIYPEKEGITILSRPRCLPSSLEYVDIERPLKGEALEMKLVSCFLENSATLKNLTVRLNASMKTEESARIFKELLAIPRLSSSCQVVVL